MARQVRSSREEAVPRVRPELAGSRTTRAEARAVAGLAWKVALAAREPPARGNPRCTGTVGSFSAIRLLRAVLGLQPRADSSWGFGSWQVDVVVINFGTNDFVSEVALTFADFEEGSRALIEAIRVQYPQAYILGTVGPLLTGADLETARASIANVVADFITVGDDRVEAFELAITDGTDGYGCDWHRSLLTHQKMADELIAVLRSTLGW